MMEVISIFCMALLIEVTTLLLSTVLYLPRYVLFGLLSSFLHKSKKAQIGNPILGIGR